jgi:hypothetical protein
MTKNYSCVLKYSRKRAPAFGREAQIKKSKLIITEGGYKDHPTLTFEEPIRRFTLGLIKLRALREAWRYIEKFFSHYEERDNDSDIKI